MRRKILHNKVMKNGETQLGGILQSDTMGWVRAWPARRLMSSNR
jgi:hypothetical protein